MEVFHFLGCFQKIKSSCHPWLLFLRFLRFLPIILLEDLEVFVVPSTSPFDSSIFFSETLLSTLFEATEPVKGRSPWEWRPWLSAAEEKTTKCAEVSLALGLPNSIHNKTPFERTEIPHVARTFVFLCFFGVLGSLFLPGN